MSTNGDNEPLARPGATVTITGLTDKNRAALLESLTSAELTQVVLDGNTATFSMVRPKALALIERVQARLADTHGTRGHPYASLHAVRMKLRTGRDVTPLAGQNERASKHRKIIANLQVSVVRLQALRDAAARTVAELDRDFAAAVQAGLPVPELANAVDWDERTVRKYVERGSQP